MSWACGTKQYSHNRYGIEWVGGDHMAEPFLAEIRILSFNFAPKGWAACNGQLLPINQNQALFALLGTTYGGNGQTTFALPNLRGAVPVHRGSQGNPPPQVSWGESSGTEVVTLTEAQMPAHGHLRGTTNQATSTTPVNNVLANAPRRGPATFASPSSTVVLNGTLKAGGNQPHQNMQPYLGLQFAIALQGIFPSPNPPN